MNCRRFLIIFTAFQLLHAGCMIVPVPMDSYSIDSRKNISEETMNRVVPGESTVEDIFLSFGEPDIYSIEAKTLTYNIRKEEWLVLWAFAYPGAAGGSSFQGTYHLVVHFNDQRIITKAEFKQGEAGFVGKWPHFYYTLFPDVPFVPEQNLISLVLHDNRPGAYGNNYIMYGEGAARKVVLDPSEVEIIRRVLTGKLTELQEEYKIATTQNFEIDLVEFSYRLYDVVFVIFSEATIQVSVQRDAAGFTLEGHCSSTNETIYTLLGKGVERTLTTEIECALQDLESDMEKQALMIIK